MRDRMVSGRNVTVSRVKLIATLKENKIKHRVEYVKAAAGYKALVLRKLQAAVKKATDSISDMVDLVATKVKRGDFDYNGDGAPDGYILLTNKVSFPLEVPMDHSDAYEVAIAMAEWETSDTIELTQGDFQCFVMDDWEWSFEFKNTVSSYTSR